MQGSTWKRDSHRWMKFPYGSLKSAVDREIGERTVHSSISERKGEVCRRACPARGAAEGKSGATLRSAAPMLENVLPFYNILRIEKWEMPGALSLIHIYFRIFYDYIQDDRYMSVSSLRKTGNLFGFDFIFGELSHKLLPFDYQAFFASPTQLMAGTTDLHTGEAIFFGKEDLDEGFTPVRASSAMPFVSKIVRYQGHELLDGSYSTSIPLDVYKRQLLLSSLDAVAVIKNWGIFTGLLS